MAFSQRYLSGVLAILLFAVGAVDASNVPVVASKVVPAKAMPTKTVELTFTVFSRERLASVCFYPDSKAVPRVLKFFTQSKSAIYNYKGEAVLSFYDQKDLPDGLQDPAAPLPRPVATVVVPPDVKRALLIFLPLAAAEPDGIRFWVLVIDDSQDRLPMGAVAVINLSDHVYRGNVEGKHLKLSHGLSENVAATGQVNFKLAYDDSGKWVAAGSYSWVMGARERVYLVLFPPASPTGIAPIIRRLSDEVAEKNESKSEVKDGVKNGVKAK